MNFEGDAKHTLGETSKLGMISFRITLCTLYYDIYSFNLKHIGFNCLYRQT